MMPELKDWLNQTTSVEPHTGYDDQGKPTFGAAVSYTETRVVEKIERVMDADGVERVSMSNVLADGDPGWTYRDRFTLPDGTVRQPISVLRHPDEDGTTSHTRAYFG